MKNKYLKRHLKDQLEHAIVERVPKPKKYVYDCFRPSFKDSAGTQTSCVA